MRQNREPKTFTPPDKEQRRNYKFAMLQPYFDCLPPDVIEVLLDHNLFKKDEDSNIIESIYEWKLASGEVNEVIAQIKTPFSK